VDNHEGSVAARSRALFDQLRSRRSGRHQPSSAGPTEGEAAAGAEAEASVTDARQGTPAATATAAAATVGVNAAGEEDTGDNAVGGGGAVAEASEETPAAAEGAVVARATVQAGAGDAPGEEAAAGEPSPAKEPAPPVGPRLAASDLEALGVGGNGDGAELTETDRHPAADLPLPRIIAIANQKGGVGKTTTAVNLGAALAELGFRTLIVDLDPQGNATTVLGVNPRNLEHAIYDVLMRDLPIDECIEPTSVRNLFVAPATIDLAGAEIELVPAFSRELRLRRALGEVRGDYDYTIIDCPPSLGLLTVNGLAAAGEVIVPIQCEYYALEGLSQLLRNVNLVRANLNPALNVSAIILTMYDARTKLADQVAAEVRQHFGPKVCRNVVPRTVRLSEAPSFGQPITVFDPASRGALAYRELAKEVSGGAPQRVG
jgi:chromosome partitioning protein